MTRIGEYRLVVSIGEDAFVADVNELIRKGWQPYGTPFLVTSGRLAQAMVKYLPKSDWSTDEAK